MEKKPNEWERIVAPRYSLAVLDSKGNVVMEVAENLTGDSDDCYLEQAPVAGQTNVDWLDPRELIKPITQAISMHQALCYRSLTKK